MSLRRSGRILRKRPLPLQSDPEPSKRLREAAAIDDPLAFAEFNPAPGNDESKPLAPTPTPPQQNSTQKQRRSVLKQTDTTEESSAAKESEGTDSNVIAPPSNHDQKRERDRKRRVSFAVTAIPTNEEKKIETAAAKFGRVADKADNNNPAEKSSSKSSPTTTTTTAAAASEKDIKPKRPPPPPGVSLFLLSPSRGKFAACLIVASAYMAKSALLRELSGLSFTSKILLTIVAAVSSALGLLKVLLLWTHENFPIVPRTHRNVIPPVRNRRPSLLRRLSSSSIGSSSPKNRTTTMDEPPVQVSQVTLRQFLTAPDSTFHLAFAPAFFGFYGYFGALAALQEELDGILFSGKVGSVAGASAGAMAAVLLSAGVEPRPAAEFASSLTFGSYADPPGLGGFLQGNLFEEIMDDFIRRKQTCGGTSDTIQLEDGKIPVAVTGFDLYSFQGKVLTKGSMARAARASACFPLLFQPVDWEDEGSSFLLIDGGVKDEFGLEGLTAVSNRKEPMRIVNIAMGNIDFMPSQSQIPDGINAGELVSISIRNSPQCGPWAMGNGPKAVDAVSKAIKAILDAPMHEGREKGHYELHIDCI